MKIAMFLLWAITIYLYSITPNEIDNGHIGSLLLICGSSSLFFIIYERLQAGRFNWISILFFFLLSYCIVHFQIPILHVFGYEIVEGYFEYFVWGSLDIVNQAVGISTLGLQSFYLGYILFSFKKRKNIAKNHSAAIKYKNSSTALFLTIGSYLFYFLFYITSGSYKKGYYAVGDQMIISNYFFSAFNLFLPGAIILRLYYINTIERTKFKFKDYILNIGFPITIITGWHCLFSVFVGDRGPVIMYVLLFFGLYVVRWKKLNLLYILLLFLVASTVLKIVGEARTRHNNKGYIERVFDSVNSNDAGYSKQYGDRNTPFAGTIELALSARCLNHSVWKVPVKENYAYGTFQLLQIISALPGAASLFHKYILGGEYKYGGSANYITVLVQGNKFTYGEGTVPTADLYLDFGVIGVVIGFFFFGVFVRKADTILLNGGSLNLFLWITILIYFSGAILLGRTSLLFYWQRVTQIYFIVWLNNIVLTTIRK